jgi:uncharacterized protein involved in response to NO
MADAASEGARARPLHPPLLQQGFRPFFLAGAVWAVVVIAWWLGLLAGVVGLGPAIDPLAWHQHEMLFGFASAPVAGFLLTAIPNWTGRLPVRGATLLALVLLWALGRLTMIGLAGWPAALVDGAFLPALTAFAAREVIAGRQWRNLVVVLLIGLFASGNLLWHLGELLPGLAPGQGLRLGIASLAMLLGLIGGRIVPSFTRNWLAKRQAPLPAPFGRLDRLALLTLASALAGWTLLPDTSAAGLLLLLAGSAQVLRLARWRPWSTRAEPLVLILHLGFAWLALGLLLLGLTQLALLPGSAALHALTAGAFGTMMLAVMTRATLGHTGRPLAADATTVAIYALVNVGAAGRVLAALWPGQAWLMTAGLLWTGAFALFVVHYGPMLLGQRADRAPA